MKIALVGCGKQKLTTAAPASDLYTGPLFRAARAWAEKHADRWFVLSAKHGLLDPSTVIEPYDVSLARMPVAERAAWGRRVLAQLGAETHGEAELILLAGEPYAEPLRATTLTVPLRGLSQGARLAWFKRQLLESATAELWERMTGAAADGCEVLFTPAEAKALLAERGARGAA